MSSYRTSPTVLAVLTRIRDAGHDAIQPLLDKATPGKRTPAKVETPEACFKWCDANPDVVDFDCSAGWYQALLDSFPREFSRRGKVMVNYKGLATSAKDLTEGTATRTDEDDIYKFVPTDGALPPIDELETCYMYLPTSPGASLAAPSSTGSTSTSTSIGTSSETKKEKKEKKTKKKQKKAKTCDKKSSDETAARSVHRTKRTLNETKSARGKDDTPTKNTGGSNGAQSSLVFCDDDAPPPTTRKGGSTSGGGSSGSSSSGGGGGGGGGGGKLQGLPNGNAGDGGKKSRSARKRRDRDPDDVEGWPWKGPGVTLPAHKVSRTPEVPTASAADTGALDLLSSTAQAGSFSSSSSSSSSASSFSSPHSEKLKAVQDKRRKVISAKKKQARQAEEARRAKYDEEQRILDAKYAEVDDMGASVAALERQLGDQNVQAVGTSEAVDRATTARLASEAALTKADKAVEDAKAQYAKDEKAKSLLRAQLAALDSKTEAAKKQRVKNVNTQQALAKQVPKDRGAEARAIEENKALHEAIATTEKRLQRYLEDDDSDDSDGGGAAGGGAASGRGGEGGGARGGGGGGCSL